MEDSIYLDEERDVSINFEIMKSAFATDEGHLISGWGNVSINADGSLPLDWQDDVIMPQTLEKAAINFMAEYRESGVRHAGGAVGTVVESIVFTKEKQAAIGIPPGHVPEGWFITVKVMDEGIFKEVQEGKLKMFSLQGRSKRFKL